MSRNTKCGQCKKRLVIYQLRCKECSHYFHKKCLSNKNGGDLICTACLNKYLPFFKVSNNDLLGNFNDKLKAGLPSFSIQSLLDEIKKMKMRVIVS